VPCSTVGLGASARPVPLRRYGRRCPPGRLFDVRVRHCRERVGDEDAQDVEDQRPGRGIELVQRVAGGAHRDLCPGSSRAHRRESPTRAAGSSGRRPTQARRGSGTGHSRRRMALGTPWFPRRCRIPLRRHWGLRRSALNRRSRHGNFRSRLSSSSSNSCDGRGPPAATGPERGGGPARTVSPPARSNWRLLDASTAGRSAAATSVMRLPRSDPRSRSPEEASAALRSRCPAAGARGPRARDRWTGRPSGAATRASLRTGEPCAACPLPERCPIRRCACRSARPPRQIPEGAARHEAPSGVAWRPCGRFSRCRSAACRAPTSL